MENEPLHSPTASSELADLRAQCNSLHSLLVSLLLLMIVLGGTFWIFMMRQASYSKQDGGVAFINYTNAQAQFERTRPIIDETVKKLQAFGKTNADFVPILSKYNLLQATPSPSPAPIKGKK